MKRIKAASLITAIKTPYTENGEVCLESYDALIELQIAAGVDGIVVGGTTGEGHLLSWEEHLMLIAHCVPGHILRGIHRPWESPGRPARPRSFLHVRRVIVFQYLSC